MENYRNPYEPRTTPHQSASERGQKKDSTLNSRKRMIINLERIIPPDGNLHGQQLRNETVIILRMTTPSGRKLMKELPKRWLKKRKWEKQCTCCTHDNHTWRKCRKPIVVATTFAYGNKGNPKPYRKPRTSTLAVHNPPPLRSEQVPKVNRVQREMPTQVWELSDTEMT